MLNFIFILSFVLYLGACFAITNDLTVINWLIAGYCVFGGLLAIAIKKSLLDKFIKLWTVMMGIGVLVMILHIFIINIFDSFPLHILITTIIYTVLSEIGSDFVNEKNSDLYDNPNYHNNEPLKVSKEDKKVKIVLHAAGTNNYFAEINKKDDVVYGSKGVVFKELSKLFLNKDVELEYVAFTRLFLHAQILHDFMSACRTADVIIVDCWNHPTDNLDWMYDPAFDPYESMARIAEEIRSQNHNAVIFARLHNPLEGIDDNDENTIIAVPKQRVHDYSIPYNDIFEKNIIDAINNVIKTKSNHSL